MGSLVGVSFKDYYRIVTSIVVFKERLGLDGQRECSGYLWEVAGEIKVHSGGWWQVL